MSVAGSGRMNRRFGRASAGDAIKLPEIRLDDQIATCLASLVQATHTPGFKSNFHLAPPLVLLANKDLICFDVQILSTQLSPINVKEQDHGRRPTCAVGTHLPMTTSTTSWYRLLSCLLLPRSSHVFLLVLVSEACCLIQSHENSIAAHGIRLSS